MIIPTYRIRRLRYVSGILVHHGVKGQHWGIRKDKKSYGNTRDIDDLWKSTREFPGLSAREKEYVYEEFDNNLSKEEKAHDIVERRINNYLYTALNKGHNQYKIIDKELQESSSDWLETLDEILTEVIGKDWRKYDD